MRLVLSDLFVVRLWTIRLETNVMCPLWALGLLGNVIPVRISCFGVISLSCLVDFFIFQYFGNDGCLCQHRLFQHRQVGQHLPQGRNAYFSGCGLLADEPWPICPNVFADAVLPIEFQRVDIFWTLARGLIIGYGQEFRESIDLANADGEGYRRFLYTCAMPLVWYCHGRQNLPKGCYSASWMDAFLMVSGISIHGLLSGVRVFSIPQWRAHQIHLWRGAKEDVLANWCLQSFLKARDVCSTCITGVDVNILWKYNASCVLVNNLQNLKCANLANTQLLRQSCCGWQVQEQLLTQIYLGSYLVAWVLILLSIVCILSSFDQPLRKSRTLKQLF